MYPDSEKLLFSSTVRGQPRRWDPLVVRRALIRAAKGKLGELLSAAATPQAMESEEPETLLARLDAQERLAGVLREAFGLPGLESEEDAVAEEEVLTVWAAWRAYVAKKNATDRTPPTFSPAAGGVPQPTMSS